MANILPPKTETGKRWEPEGCSPLPINKYVRKSFTVNVKLEFPEEVNTEGIREVTFDIVRIREIEEILAEYGTVRLRYLNIKNENFRWVFPSNKIEERYTPQDIKNKGLIVKPWMQQKWYRGKYITINLLTQSFDYRKIQVPFDIHTYRDEPHFCDAVYSMLSSITDSLGKYLDK